MGSERHTTLERCIHLAAYKQDIELVKYFAKKINTPWSGNQLDLLFECNSPEILEEIPVDIKDLDLPYLPTVKREIYDYFLGEGVYATVNCDVFLDLPTNGR